MFLLPKGKPWVENLPIAKLLLPDALDKLKKSELTGCASFDFPSADCVLLYDEGKLISALLRRDKTVQKDADALRTLIDLMFLADSGSFTVYGFSRSVNQALLALMRGTTIINQQELKRIDFKALLERIKDECMTATLKIYTDQRVGMILYQDGAPVGFFHDTALTIGTTAGEVQQIAALAGASADLIALTGTEMLTLDLTGVVNIRSLWEAAAGDVFASHESGTTSQPLAVPIAQGPPPTASGAAIESAIIAIAISAVGKLGRTLTEKELINVGGIKVLKDETKLSEFLNAVGKSSKLLASTNKIREMCDAISSEAAKL